ncbi:hypothetical protein NOCARDAX2BIS_330032 [Nocardioides sp. AX2bis]|nr:hypothetical protein NOCARDAX2BIS_330032 [Nocardioides sp. AX2bis]
MALPPPGRTRPRGGFTPGAWFPGSLPDGSVRDSTRRPPQTLVVDVLGHLSGHPNLGPATHQTRVHRRDVGPAESGRLDLGTVDGLHEPQRRHQPAGGQQVEGAPLLVVEGQLGRRPEEHRHHAVVAGQSADHAGVAVDSRRHASNVAPAADSPRAPTPHRPRIDPARRPPTARPPHPCRRPVLASRP